MVTGALTRQSGAGNTSGRDAATGGVSLAALPPPEHLGPIGAYLSGEAFASWARGQIMFSNGGEVAWVAPPRLLEVARTRDVGSLTPVLESFVSSVLAPAEASQTSGGGGGNPRLGDAFAASAAAAASPNAARAVIVSDVPRWTEKLAEALTARGFESMNIDQPASDFAGASKQLADIANDAGPMDAVIVALAGGDTAPAEGAAWQRALDEHAGVVDGIATDAAWARAVADLSAATERSLRLVTLVDASNAGGRTRAAAATQLSRAAHGATGDRVDACAVSVEAHDQPVAEIVAHLAGDPGASVLSGAELVVGADWFGMRRHPHPAGTISFGGPDVPDWVDSALRDLVVG
jgi:hypothetical protein